MDPKLSKVSSAVGCGDCSLSTRRVKARVPVLRPMPDRAGVRSWDAIVPGTDRRRVERRPHILGNRFEMLALWPLTRMARKLL